jgi:hypothetical protein
MYSGITSIFSRYWRAYGGVAELVKSPYLHIAIVLQIFSAHYWLNNDWWELPLSILPNLLGFSLGGLTMFLSFGDERFKFFLSEKNEESGVSPFLEFCASFVHFIVLQLFALGTALVCKALDFSFEWPGNAEKYVTFLTGVFSGLGYLLFLYSVTSMLAATMAVFRACSWYEAHKQSQSPPEY